jgi:hypothetical protein
MVACLIALQNQPHATRRGMTNQCRKTAKLSAFGNLPVMSRKCCMRANGEDPRRRRENDGYPTFFDLVKPL